MTIQYQAEGVTLFESALFRTVTTVVEGTDFVLVVDPNWLPAEVAEIADFAERVGEGKHKFLLFTHSDYDHIIGYGAFPGWTTVASQRFVDNPDRASQLRQAREWDDEYYIERAYELVYPLIAHPIAGDDGHLALGAHGRTRFFQAPGHNYDGLVTWLPERGILIVGDYLSNIEFPYVYHSFQEYALSLDKLERLLETERVALLVTGHGDATTDPEEMRARVTESRAYLDELTRSVRTGRPFDLDTLFRRYAFPGIMRKFHAKNVQLLQQQLAAITEQS